MRERIARQIRRAAGDERGVALILVALGLTAFLGVAALALDMGMLYTARTESQRVADGAALAGASQFIENPNDPALESLVREEAKAYAAMNHVRGAPVTLEDTDIEVWLADDSVKVTVRHIEGHANGSIATYFARVLGFDIGEVITNATAWAAPHGSTEVTCPLPVAMADKWFQHPDGTAAWEPDIGDHYCPPGGPPDDPNYPNPGCTHDPTVHSYTSTDVGTEFMLKPSQGGTSLGSGNEDEGAYFEPGFWYLWLPDGCAGVKDVMDFILSCDVECGYSVAEGDTLTDQNGNAQAVEKAFEDLIAQDPDAYWEEGCTGGLECIKGSKCDLETESCELSPRVRATPLFDPNTFVLQGSDENFVTSNLVYIFVDHVDPGPPGKRNVWARYAGAAGLGGADEGPTTKVVKVLRLVE